MGKTAKITLECDGQKFVWETDSLNMQQSRDVKRYEFAGDPKSKFKPGDSTLVIVAFRPRVISEECIPVPTIESAFAGVIGREVEERMDDPVSESLEKLSKASSKFALDGMKTAGDDAQAIQESRRDMVSEIKWADFYKSSEIVDKAMKRTIGMIIGQWEIIALERRGRNFKIRVRHTHSKAELDVERFHPQWEAVGVVQCIAEEAKKRGIVV